MIGEFMGSPLQDGAFGIYVAMPHLSTVRGVLIASTRPCGD
jgi:hypothetical protein